MSFYLDASVMLPILVEEAGSPAVDAFMSTTREILFVSDFAAAEVASGLSRLVRMGLLVAEDAADRLADFDAWRASLTTDFEFHAADIRLANIYVRRFDLMLRAPDALHAAACRRADVALVTLDRRLASAAEKLGLSIRLLQ